jgi:arginase family enzyme
MEMEYPMNKSFVDHLQLLPMPSRSGVRQPDGDHRPGGLGLRTLADRLGPLGWTARHEDFGFEKPVAEARITEAYARAIGDAVLSAWDRSRFPVVLSLVNACALGVVDGLGSRVGVLWFSPRADYTTSGFFRRPKLDRTTLAMMTGRQQRDSMAVKPCQLAGRNVIVVGAQKIDANESRALDDDGLRVIGPDVLSCLPAAVADTDVDGWYVHIDATVLEPDAVPAADEAVENGLAVSDVVTAIEGALANRPIRCLSLTRYDLNRDFGGVTAQTLAGLLDRTIVLAGGQPDPQTRETAQAT